MAEKIKIRIKRSCISCYFGNLATDQIIYTDNIKQAKNLITHGLAEAIVDGKSISAATAIASIPNESKKSPIKIEEEAEKELIDNDEAVVSDPSEPTKEETPGALSQADLVQPEKIAKKSKRGKRKAKKEK